jgi:hypothetical protein
MWLESEYKDIPDYPNDLNAVHEAEKSLDRFQVSEYGIELCRVMKLPDINGEICWGSLVMATARQRCEALLKTVGLWKE